jgi:hypothetical protein
VSVIDLDCDQCYRATERRDVRFDGWFVVGVRTTLAGIATVIGAAGVLGLVHPAPSRLRGTLPLRDDRIP